MKTWIAAVAATLFTAGTALAAPVSYTVDFEFSQYGAPKYAGQVVSGSVTYQLDLDNRVSGGLPANNFFNELEILDFSLFGLTGNATVDSGFNETNVSAGYAMHPTENRVTSGLIRPTSAIGSYAGGAFYFLLGGNLAEGEIIKGVCFGGFSSLTTEVAINAGGITLTQPCASNLIVGAASQPPVQGNAAVPLPAGLPLIAGALGALGLLRRRRRG